MKEFIDKLIRRFEEEPAENIMAGKDYIISGNAMPKERVIEIVNELAEEYKTCYKSCTDCEAYDKEKHYCPKWCDVIKHTTSELAEEYKVSEMSTGWIPCSIKKPDYEIYEVKKLWVTMHRKEVKHCFTRQLTWNGWQGRWEWDNGKPLSDKWEVIAWKLIDIPAPYMEGE